MADGAEKLLKNKKIRVRLGESARNSAFDLLDPGEQTRQEIAVYSHLLGESVDIP